MKKIVTGLFLSLSLCLNAQETLNAMFYNLFKFPNALPQNRELILQSILDDYKPDLFMVCELVTENGADLILNTSLQNQVDTFARANFVADVSKPDDPIQTMVYYNTRKLTLLSQQKLVTVYRDINQYSFKVNVDPANPIYLEVFVAHLKSSTGAANQQTRLQMVEAVTNKLQQLTLPNTFVLFAGDFNFYTATEPGYQKIIDPQNAIVLKDPVNMPGSWQDNPAFAHIHTQSTRVSSVGFGGGTNSGAGGGVDDRFDFIMMSENFINNTRFSYINGTYKAYGNNGDCLNKDVNDTASVGVYSQTLRNQLYNMSDHMPVVMQFQVNENLSTKEVSMKPLMWFESSNKTDSELYVGVNLDLLKSTQTTLSIYNTLGELVTSIPVRSKSVVISIEDFASGLYFIKMSGTNSVLKFTKK